MTGLAKSVGWLLLGVAVVAALPLVIAAQGVKSPGKLESLVLPPSFVLAGRDAGRQLVVSGKYVAGAEQDWTGKVVYEVKPAGIVQVDESGYVTSLKEGEATIVASADGLSATVHVRVTDLTRDLQVHFANDVVPIFTRFGCNAGGCHGKSGGQNGFQLSLLGFEPQEDFEFLVKEARGRRLLPAAPEASLLLQKATGQMPHGGGAKLPADSPFYRILRRWVEQGMPYGRTQDAEVVRIEVSPRERIMQRGGSQQLAVLAHYSDGATRDVTRLTQFEANDTDMAQISDTGLVTTRELPGMVAIMARFQIHVDVCRITLPLGPAPANLPTPANFVDELASRQWHRLGLTPAPLCDDGTFLRRATIDLAGRLPTLDETRAFLADKAPERREKLVDRLLASPDYADYFAVKWSAVLRNKRESPKDDPKPHQAFHGWIRDSLASNKPFDQFVREILTATGEEIQNPPVTWYREVKDREAQVEDTAQLFLGTRIQCARCHHHPLEKWSQQDYYGLAAFFSQVTYQKPPKVEAPKGQKKANLPNPLVHIVHRDGVPKAVNPRTGLDVRPTVLGGAEYRFEKRDDPRVKLAAWITARDNPLFAKALVNRYWKHFFGRGLVSPEDDLRVTNPPTNPELLDALARHFVDSKFDLKKLVRTICTANVYQLASDANGSDRQNYSCFLPRRLHAEVLFDAIDQVTLAQSEFPGMPAGTRAVQLPDCAFESYFLTLFGRPDGSSACECERSSEVALSQLLHLMNSMEVLAKISGAAPIMDPKSTGKGKTLPAPKTKVTPGERLNKIVKDARPHEEKIRELFLIAYSRAPSRDELALLQAHLDGRRDDVRGAYEDILWVVINSEEFLFNH